MMDFLQTPGLMHWLILTTALFSVGLYGVLVRRNAIAILMSVEIMLNAVALNLVIFNRFIAPTKVDGQVMTIFIIAVAAAEIVVGMAIFVSLSSKKASLDVTEMDGMKG